MALLDGTTKPFAVADLPLREGQGTTLEQGPLAPAILQCRSVAFGGTEFQGQSNGCASQCSKTVAAWVEKLACITATAEVLPNSAIIYYAAVWRPYLVSVMESLRPAAAAR